MKLTLGVLAHVDAGKTTLSERLMHHCGVIRTVGRVDDGTAHLDYSEIEKNRGITVFSDAVRMSVGEDVITLIDTPGHVDFSPEAERAISVMDYAILVVSATDGVQSHTETIWRLLREYKVPVFVFINKTDAYTADADRALQDLKNRLSEDIMDFSDGLPEELAEKSEALLDEYIENGRLEVSDEVKELIATGCVFPCFRGSALCDENVDLLLNSITTLAKEKASDDPFSATCYKVRRVGNSRMCYLRINSGIIKVKDVVKTANGDEKIDEIKFPSGEKLVPVQCAECGDVCAVSGLTGVFSGDTIGSEVFRRELTQVPVFSSRIIYDSAYSHREIFEKLKILEDEDNTLNVTYNEALGEISVSVMGNISLQVLEYEFERRFGIKIGFGSCSVIYKETVAEAVVGYGHFEPLRHYAEVHIKISPKKQNGAISYKSECSTDVLAPNAQNAIRTHVFEKKHKGVLVGGELCDVECSLVMGRVHEKHTEGGDLREATYRAIRQGLMRAKSVLLEPWLAFTIRSDMQTAGKIMADVGNMGGEFTPPMSEGDTAVTSGRAPARLFSEYAESLATGSGGKVSVSMRVDGYEPCKDQERLVEEIGYEPERDLENTPDSVFCAKGAGFTVKWYDAESYMDCL